MTGRVGDVQIGEPAFPSKQTRQSRHSKQVLIETVRQIDEWDKLKAQFNTKPCEIAHCTVRLSRSFQKMIIEAKRFSLHFKKIVERDVFRALLKIYEVFFCENNKRLILIKNNIVDV